MSPTIRALCLSFGGLLALASAADPAPAMPVTPSEPGASVYFVEPADGAVITGPVQVAMGLKGMGIAPAGIDFPATGHHHLIVNAPTPPAGAIIPMDANHLHFGKGQTETSLDLPAGTHTLQLVLADRNHIPHEPAVVSPVITITVK